MFHEIFILLQKEFKNELTKKTSLLSILLYIASISYLLFFLMKTQGALVKLEVKFWNMFYWVIVLFSIINSIYINFSKDNKARMLYYFNMFRPESFILSKLIYHSIFSTIIALFTYLFFGIWLGNPIENNAIFLLTVLIATNAFSAIYTLMTAISFQTNQSTLLSSILGFPITIPIIIFTTKLCREAFSETISGHFYTTLFSLLGFNFILIFLSIILFPFLWKE